MRTEPARHLQETVEEHPLGRSIITGVIVFILATLLASNLSDSWLRAQVSRLVEPVRNSVGLDQAWGVFAPDPRSLVFDLEARIRYGDGTSEVWRYPMGDPLVSEYREYHWQKFAEQVRLDAEQPLWRPFAEWIARTHERGGKHPAQVVLVRRWYELFGPGAKPSHGPWQEYVYFTLDVTPSAPAKEPAR